MVLPCALPTAVPSPRGRAEAPNRSEETSFQLPRRAHPRKRRGPLPRFACCCTRVRARERRRAVVRSISRYGWRGARRNGPARARAQRAELRARCVGPPAAHSGFGADATGPRDPTAVRARSWRSHAATRVRPRDARRMECCQRERVRPAAARASATVDVSCREAERAACVYSRWLWPTERPCSSPGRSSLAY